MNKEELQRYLNLSSGHSVVVHVQEIEEAPGNVRIITIHRGNEVTIEFQICRTYLEDPMEKGAVFAAKYESMDELIADLEKYLGLKIAKWSNFTREPFIPQILDEPDPDKNDKWFHEVVRNKKLKLPSRRKYKPTSIYWQHIVKYGEFKPDIECNFEEND